MRLATWLICLTSLAAGSAALSQTSPGEPAKSAVAIKPTAASTPTWKELSASEQTALRPLAANWDSMGIGQKRKWQSVAKDFDKLPAPQQAKMHARMTEWTALSSKQRADARINFAQNRELTDGLTPEQRKVQWQAYQQLSPEEKRQLAQSAPRASLAGAAPAAKPQPVLKKEPKPDFGTAKVLANAKSATSLSSPSKKIAVAPHVATHGSVLPGSMSDTSSKP
jgi:Protein of unknown function (DUF3106)